MRAKASNQFLSAPMMILSFWMVLTSRPNGWMFCFVPPNYGMGVDPKCALELVELLEFDLNPIDKIGALRKQHRNDCQQRAHMYFLNLRPLRSATQATRA